MHGLDYLPTDGHFDVSRRADRALLLARPDDVVVVFEPLDAAYLAFLAGLGIGPRPERVVALGGPCAADPQVLLATALAADRAALARVADLAQDVDRLALNPYRHGPSEGMLERSLARRLGARFVASGADHVAVSQADRKHRFRAAAQELGVPIAPGEVVAVAAAVEGSAVNAAPLSEAVDRIRQWTGRVIIRRTRGSEGVGTAVMNAGDVTLPSCLLEPIELPGDRFCLVEAMFDVAISPNVGMFIPPGGGEIRFVGATDQILHGGVEYLGNRFPSRAATLPEMLADAWRMSDWLQARGVCGHIGFDFCEYADAHSGRPHYFLAELNPRVNGTTYVQGLVARLNDRAAQRGLPAVRAFQALKLSTTARSFSELSDRYGDLLFDPHTAAGIVPYNTLNLPSGRCWLALLGNSPQDLAKLVCRLRETHDP